LVWTFGISAPFALECQSKTLDSYVPATVETYLDFAGQITGNHKLTSGCGLMTGCRGPKLGGSGQLLVQRRKLQQEAGIKQTGERNSVLIIF